MRQPIGRLECYTNLNVHFFTGLFAAFYKRAKIFAIVSNALENFIERLNARLKENTADTKRDRFITHSLLFNSPLTVYLQVPTFKNNWLPMNAYKQNISM
jgi:hypothetical protein